MVTDAQLSYDFSDGSARVGRTLARAGRAEGERGRLFCRWASVVTSPEARTDEELVETICRGADGEAEACREVLFRRFYPKVLSWCRRFSGDHQEASDLAQDVLLRVHERLHTFKGRSRFSTWLYTVTRRTAINRGIAARRRAALSIEEEQFPEPVDPAPDARERAETDQLARELRRAMARDLESLEAKILYLHYVDGMTLPAITSLLRLENKSGAKAYIVSARRKLDRRFGRWLRRQTEITAM